MSERSKPWTSCLCEHSQSPANKRVADQDRASHSKRLAGPRIVHVNNHTPHRVCQNRTAQSDLCVGYQGGVPAAQFGSSLHCCCVIGHHDLTCSPVSAPCSARAGHVLQCRRVLRLILRHAADVRRRTAAHLVIMSLRAVWLTGPTRRVSEQSGAASTISTRLQTRQTGGVQSAEVGTS